MRRVMGWEGLYYVPDTDIAAEVELRGRVEVPAGAEAHLMAEDEAGPIDLAFLDAVPSDLLVVGPNLWRLAVHSSQLAPASLAPLVTRGELVAVGLGRIVVDDHVADALIALRPPLEGVDLVDPAAAPSPAVLERLLAAGLEVNDVSASPGSAAQMAQALADRVVDDVEDDDSDEEEPASTTDGDLPSISKADELDALVATGGRVLVDLGATWCGPCHTLEPILAEIATELRGQLAVRTIDVDEAPWIKDRFEVMAVPTMVLFNQGAEVARITGAHPKRTLLPLIATALQLAP